MDLFRRLFSAANHAVLFACKSNVSSSTRSVLTGDMQPVIVRTAFSVERQPVVTPEQNIA